MARGKKTGGKDFAKGKSGNPGGKSKADGELQAARNLSKEQLKEILNLIATHPREELQQIVDKHDTPFLIEWTLVLALRADLAVWNAFMDRLVGKVKDEVEHSVADSLAALIAGTGE